MTASAAEVEAAQKAMGGCEPVETRDHESGVYDAHCDCCGASWSERGCGLAVAVADAVVASLGVTQETGLHPMWVDDGPCDGACQTVACDGEHRRHRLVWVNRRRLVSPWVEVQP